MTTLDLRRWTIDQLTARADAEAIASWTCPATRRDCREERAPVLALLEGPDGGVAQMYATQADADAVTPHSVECRPGMRESELLAKWVHYAGKPWLAANVLTRAMVSIYWQFVRGQASAEGGGRS